MDRAKKQKIDSPIATLLETAKERRLDINDEQFAQYLDKTDSLRSLRDEFVYPKMKDLGTADTSLVDGDEDCVYLCGNSYGLLPRGLRTYIDIELDKWSKIGVYGHKRGDMPWIYCDECIEKDMAKLVGTKEDEIAMMNGLTVNIHLAFISFYRPTKTRYKILIESKAFPSDYYTATSQIRLHNLDPKDCLLEIEPREGKETLELDDILDIIEKEGSSIAVVWLSGVQYYTGQLLDMVES